MWSGRLRLRVWLRSITRRSMSGFVLRPSTIRTDVSRIGRGSGGLMFHRERGRRREVLRLRRLFEGIHSELRLRRGFKWIRSSHLRSGLESEALGLRNLERSFGRLATLREAYGFRVLLWLVHADD